MTRKSKSLSWDEMRANMIAGLFWYLVGLLNWTLIYASFQYLRSHVGTVLTVLLDLLAIVATYWIVLQCIRMWKEASEVQELARDLRLDATPPVFTTVLVTPENSNDEKIGYKSKVRIVFRNDSQQTFEIQNAVWIANGNVSLELPPKLGFQIETGGDGKWSKDGFTQFHIRPRQAFRTWIGLHDRLSDSDFLRAHERKQFGTLLLNIVEWGELKIRV